MKLCDKSPPCNLVGTLPKTVMLEMKEKGDSEPFAGEIHLGKW